MELDKPLQLIDRYHFRETDLEIIREISEEQDALKQTLSFVMLLN